jgi:hypothetical protein
MGTGLASAVHAEESFQMVYIPAKCPLFILFLIIAQKRVVFHLESGVFRVNLRSEIHQKSGI